MLKAVFEEGKKDKQQLFSDIASLNAKFVKLGKQKEPSPPAPPTPIVKPTASQSALQPGIFSIEGVGEKVTPPQGVWLSSSPPDTATLHIGQVGINAIGTAPTTGMTNLSPAVKQQVLKNIVQPKFT